MQMTAVSPLTHDPYAIGGPDCSCLFVEFEEWWVWLEFSGCVEIGLV